MISAYADVFATYIESYMNRFNIKPLCSEAFAVALSLFAARHRDRSFQ